MVLAFARLVILDQTLVYTWLVIVIFFIYCYAFFNITLMDLLIFFRILIINYIYIKNQYIKRYSKVLHR